MDEAAGTTITRTHHVGMSVADIEAALGFWEKRPTPAPRAR